MTVPPDRRFGTVAATYDRVRPGTPPELVDAVLARAFPAGTPLGRAVEVGAGTGLATQAFAARGVDVTCYEPDPAMAAVLRDRFADRPGVHVVPDRFENARDGGFGLLFSAQAWHWIDPAVRWDRAADVLAPGGTLALFWNHDHVADDVVRAAAADVHGRYTTDVRDGGRLDETAIGNEPPATELRQDPRFTDVAHRVFRWQRLLPRGEYVDLLGTFSPQLALDADQRRRLFDELTAVLPDQVALDMDTALYLATRRP
jgi:SAM-dependent methyltransferase